MPLGMHMVRSPLGVAFAGKISFVICVHLPAIPRSLSLEIVPRGIQIIDVISINLFVMGWHLLHYCFRFKTNYKHQMDRVPN